MAQSVQMTYTCAKVANMSLRTARLSQKTDILTYIFSFTALAQVSLLSRRRAFVIPSTIEDIYAKTDNKLNKRYNYGKDYWY